TLSLLPPFSSLYLSLPSISSLFPYTTLFRSHRFAAGHRQPGHVGGDQQPAAFDLRLLQRRAPRRDHPDHAELRSSHRGRRRPPRSEEHTSELQSRENIVCRLLLEKKKKKYIH